MYVINHDFHAIHHSGDRLWKDILYIVEHDIESTNLTGAAEGAAHWFTMAASGGSAQFCVDNDSIQQTLSMLTEAWGAPSVNHTGIHIEHMGVAHWTGAQWKAKAMPTIKRSAWLHAHIVRTMRDHGVKMPLVHLSDAQLRSGSRRGIVTHAQCTRVFGGSHTDPGSGFPLGLLIEKAKALL